MKLSDEISDLRPRLETLASRVRSDSKHYRTEADVELLVLVPYLRNLGYAHENIREVRSKVNVAPSGASRAEVDFVILRELGRQPKPFVLVEAKSFGKPIGRKEVDQLLGYFGPTTARFGLLTNGDCCQWFRRQTGKLLMDDRPFLVHSILEPSDREIEWLSAISNGNSDRDSLERLAWRLSLEDQIRTWLLTAFEGPGNPAAISMAAKLGATKKRFRVGFGSGKSCVARSHIV